MDAIVDIPNGKSYQGDLYRSLSVNSETNYGAVPNKMTDYSFYSSWGRYDLDQQENAMYLSKEVSGNKTELVPHYGQWTEFNTYLFADVEVDNLLNLTDDAICQKLGIEFEQLTKVIEIPDNLPLDEISKIKHEMYEFTNIIASWARGKGYNGLIVIGARGLKNYENIVLFDQAYIDQIFLGKSAAKVNK
ncbi:hypothetical protein [Marinoscillum sp.]|uniref:hypothetical protein n=1 Tax=Marinoscillum sp. TaxID=2024838 RepID=UPI003BAB11C1